MSWDSVIQPFSKGGLGLRRARDVNTALLGELVWSLLRYPGKLWVKVLSHKYLRNNSVLDYVSMGSSSYIWHPICKAATILMMDSKSKLGMALPPFGMIHGVDRGLFVSLLILFTSQTLKLEFRMVGFGVNGI